MTRLADLTLALDRAEQDSTLVELPDRPTLAELEVELGPSRRMWPVDGGPETAWWLLTLPGRRVLLSADLAAEDRVERVRVAHGLPD